MARTGSPPQLLRQQNRRATAALRNVISGNTGNGVFLDNNWRTTVVGNHIGSARWAERRASVASRAASGGDGEENAIGGSNTGEGNSFRGTTARRATQSSSQESRVAGTLRHDGHRRAVIHNDLNGVDIASYSTDDVIGGAVPGCRNVISGNPSGGIGANMPTGS